MNTKINTKPIPIIITLAAAFISCVVSILQRVEFSVFVARLLVVVLIFMFMGTVIKLILDYSFRTLEPAEPLDGAEASEITGLEDEDELIEEDGEEVSESEEG